MKPVLSAIVGDSADAIRQIARLYIPYESRVLDMTYGKGVFWRKTWWPRGLVRVDIVAADHMDVVTDFRHLPFADSAFHVVVFDPPYKTGSSAPLRDEFDGYGNNDRTARGWSAVMRLYRQGIEEAARVLKPGGKLIVKCMDQVESGRNHFVLPRIWGIALWYDLEPLDLFVLVRKSQPPMRHNHQVHARKNHSYFVVLRKVVTARKDVAASSEQNRVAKAAKIQDNLCDVCGEDMSV